MIDPITEDYAHWSQYNYAKNSPLVYIDPDGMSAGGWSTRFVNPFGSTLVNTNDGSYDVVIVPWGSVAGVMHDVNSSRNALARGEVPAWNQKWKNRFGVAISQDILDKSVYYYYYFMRIHEQSR